MPTLIDSKVSDVGSWGSNDLLQAIDVTRHPIYKSPYDRLAKMLHSQHS